jgi:hypothetical protein
MILTIRLNERKIIVDKNRPFFIPNSNWVGFDFAGGLCEISACPDRRPP